MPSQAPAHEELSLAHAVRVPWGAPVAGEHVPTLPETSHAWHWPEHALSQQTPSTQWAVPHWLSAVQALAGAFLGTHVPESHQAVEAQSPSPPQVDLQSVAPQAKLPQLLVTAPAQLPVPAHCVGSVAVPPEQEAARHCVEAPG